MEQFSLSIVDPSGVVYRGPIWQLSVRNPRGRLSIRAHHCDFLTSLRPGPIEIATTPEQRQTLDTRNAVLSMAGNACTVVSEGITQS